MKQTQAASKGDSKGDLRTRADLAVAQYEMAFFKQVAALWNGPGFPHREIIYPHGRGAVPDETRLDF